MITLLNHFSLICLMTLEVYGVIQATNAAGLGKLVKWKGKREKEAGEVRVKMAKVADPILTPTNERTPPK